MGLRRNGLASCFVAFGIGLLAYLILPAKLMVIVLIIALILCSLTCGRR